jgi:hypothetical protein
VVPFVGTYLALMAVGLLGLALMSAVRFPAHRVAPAPGAAAGRSLRELARSRCFAAVIGAALGYGVMNLLMAATPIAMGSAATPSSAPRWCWSGMCWACSCRASSPAT